MDVFGSSDFVAPLLRTGIHAGVEIRVVEHNRVCVKHVAHSRAATIGQDGTEELSVAVECLYLILMEQGKSRDVRVKAHLNSYTCKCNR